MRYSLSILALTTIASSCVAALGINCRGDGRCSFVRTYQDQSIADSLRQEIAGIVSDSRWYQNHQKIVCLDVTVTTLDTTGSICAFLQGTGGIPGNEIKTLAQRIVGHGCKICGSVPVYFDRGDNDVKSHGELTFNFVERNVEGDGSCKFTSGKCYYE
jgi:hypothetical protein